MNQRIGIWLIGNKGGIASTVSVGLCALQQGAVGEIGLASCLPQFSRLGFADWSSFVLGGHEIRDLHLADEALRMVTDSRAIERTLVEGLRDEFRRVDERTRWGTIRNVGPTIAGLADPAVPRDGSAEKAIVRLQRDLEEFRQANNLAHTVVVNVSSTEPMVSAADLPLAWSEWEGQLDGPLGRSLPASTLYAIAALDLGLSYINFTPSLGSSPPAVGELAILRGARHMGCDGKTGETLMKSVLAPMFANRNLHVMSWVGHNIFGNMDGVVLNDPANKQAKVQSKDHLLAQILGYRPQTLVSIEYIQSLGDWKTAWDHIHFRGFLGTPMTLQFVWQGCDSLLAAPLVLDLVRFSELAWRRGETGTMRFLASFFKSPYEVDQQSFAGQFQQLEAWADRHSPQPGGDSAQSG